MKKFAIALTKLLLFFMPISHKKKKTIRKCVGYSLQLNGCSTDLKTYKKDIVRANSVLVIEPNTYHGEIIASYVKYFIDLGFNVDLLANPKALEEQPLAKTNFGEKLNTYKIDPLTLFFLLKHKKINDYKAIFFNSSLPSFLPYLNEQNRKKVITVEHQLNDLALDEDKLTLDLYNNKRISVITNFNNNPNVIMINPHYFGEVSITPKNINITNFLIIGRLEKHIKNTDLLLESINNLIEKGITNFKITLIGSGKVKFDEKISQFIEIKGRLDFPQMFKTIEEADYILPLLDINNSSHRKYLSELSTGATQLVLGFNKPYVINEEYAKAYYFDEKSAITYKDNLLTEAMINAINLSQDQYSELQQNISEVAKRKYNESIENIKEVLNLKS
jgi:hypothetical protein